MALPHSLSGKSACLKSDLANENKVWKDLSAFPFSHGCSTLLNRWVTPSSSFNHFSNVLFRNSVPRSNCQVKILLPVRAVIESWMVLLTRHTSSAVFCSSKAITTSWDISSTTVRTYLFPLQSRVDKTAKSEWRCSPGHPFGWRLCSLPWFSARYLACYKVYKVLEIFQNNHQSPSSHAWLSAESSCEEGVQGEHV